jgi:sugar/nucleoside kinase (ribokinase family)
VTSTLIPAEGGRVDAASDRDLDIIAFGAIFLEMVFGTIPALPGPGEEIFTDQFAISCGGAISVACAARSVGATSALATVLGEDLGAKVAGAHCAKIGVDTSVSRRVAGSTSGVTVVVNFNGDRSFISHLPDHGVLSRDASWWPDVVRARRPKWIYLHARESALPVIREARRMGCLVAVDTELGTVTRAPDVVLECAAAADVFLPNRRELSRLSGTDDLGRSIARIATAGTTIIVKEGAEGAVIADGTGSQRIVTGLHDVEVEDRTGAGDAFAGALLGSLARGLDVVSAVEAGNAAGSQAVARLGAVGAITGYDEKEIV